MRCPSSLRQTSSDRLREATGDPPVRVKVWVQEFGSRYAVGEIADQRVVKIVVRRDMWSHWKQHELPNFCPQSFAQLSLHTRRALQRMRRRAA